VKQSENFVESSVLHSDLVSVSVRSSGNSKPSNSIISEIEVKDLQSPIMIEIPLKAEIRNAEKMKCMYMDETK